MIRGDFLDVAEENALIHRREHPVASLKELLEFLWEHAPDFLDDTKVCELRTLLKRPAGAAGQELEEPAAPCYFLLNSAGGIVPGMSPADNIMAPRKFVHEASD